MNVYLTEFAGAADNKVVCVLYHGQAPVDNPLFVCISPLMCLAIACHPPRDR